MRADLRAKARPAFASLRGWASPIGSGANLGLLCAVDRRAPGRGRGLGGAASDAFRKGDRLRAWAQPRQAQLVQRRAGLGAAMGLVLASRDWRPASALAGRPAKAPKRKPAAGPAWGVPVGIPVARSGCRAAPPTPKSFPVLRRLINRGKSPSFGLQAVLAMKAGRMGGAAPRAGRPTGLGDWGRSISSAFYSLRSGARRIGARCATHPPKRR